MMNLKILKGKLKSLKRTLKFLCSTQKTLLYAILDGLYYSKQEDKEEFEFRRDKQKLADVIGQEIFDKLESKKEFLQLDLSLVTFEAQCHLVNDLLMSENLFLRVYELRKKFCYLIKKVPKGKNTITKELSSCVEERFNGFQLVKRLGENERR